MEGSAALKKILNSVKELSNLGGFEGRTAISLDENKHDVEMTTRVAQIFESIKIRDKGTINEDRDSIDAGITAIADNDIGAVKSFTKVTAHGYVAGKMLETLIFR